MDISRLQSLFGLEGKRAVVTGGSRGIGYMIADGLLDAGADVIISARKEAQVAEAVEALSAKGNIEGIPAMKKGYRYRLQYGGKALHDDDILDYVVAADNPIVTVLKIREAAETASLCSDSDGAYLAVPVEAGVPSTDLRHAGELIAFDGNAYTRHEFIQYYGEHDGAYFWDRAAPCVPEALTAGPSS